MLVSAANKEQASVYRCDLCGRTGFWKSDGYAWQFYGAIEGDGFHLCSDECVAAVPDIEAAFREMFKIDHCEYNGSWAIRKHNGLIGDAPPRQPRDRLEDSISPTEGTRPTCPACGFVMDPPTLSELQIGGRTMDCPSCVSAVSICADVTFCAVVTKLSNRGRAVVKESKQIKEGK